MIINYNVSSMIANNALARNDAALSKSLERLSSGYKINHAKDNASGLAMARRMNAQLRGLDVAGDNVNDGISIVEIADGAMSEIHDILQRMNELAVKSCNGTLCDEDRVMIDEELQALKDEVERIGQTTQFNGQNLLDGNFDLKGYSSTEEFTVDYYKEGMVYGNYQFGEIICVFDEEGNLTDKTKITEWKKYDQSTPPQVIEERPAIVDPDGNEVTNYKVSAEYNEITITAAEGFEIKFTVNTDTLTDDQGKSFKENMDANNQNPDNPPNPRHEYKINQVDFDLTGIGTMTLQVGANEDQTLELRMPPITKKNLGLSHTDVLTAESSGEAINDIANAISFVSSIRSSLGAYQNRLEHTTTNLDISTENMTGAYSRIMDVDMATEMTKYSSYQVISQAATSLLAQANERPSQVLQLLQ